LEWPVALQIPLQDQPAVAENVHVSRRMVALPRKKDVATTVDLCHEKCYLRRKHLSKADVPGGSLRAAEAMGEDYRDVDC
jgi:hypothetical protein